MKYPTAFQYSCILYETKNDRWNAFGLFSLDTKQTTRNKIFYTFRTYKETLAFLNCCCWYARWSVAHFKTLVLFLTWQETTPYVSAKITLFIFSGVFYKVKRTSHIKFISVCPFCCPLLSAFKPLTKISNSVLEIFIESSCVIQTFSHIDP